MREEIDKPVTETLPDIQPEELKQKLDCGEKVFVLDVRDPHEYQICNIGGHLIPLSELPNRLSELDRDCLIVAHCKMGRRGAKAVELLRQSGFSKVRNLTGGILAWADRIDPKLQKY